jgi:hypothetical protein
MSEDALSPGIAAIVQRLPHRASLILRLAAEDEGFCELAYGLSLARATLAEFEARPDAAQRIEVADYRELIDELEAEVTASIAAFASRGPKR